MSQIYTFTISDEFKDFTLHRFLTDKLKELQSGKQIKKAIEDGKCVVNGRMERFGSIKLLVNDSISIQFDKKNTQKVQILFENEEFFAIDKWAGLICEDTAVRKFFPGTFLIHRLDKETTGVLLIAKSEPVKKRFIELFREGKILKQYLALCSGYPSKNSGSIKNFLTKQGEFKGQTLYKGTLDGPGQYAETHWKVLKKVGNDTLIECRPITGRTHQLRVHLKEIGCPIVGDVLYNKKGGISPRMMLHAQKLEIVPLGIIIESHESFFTAT
ncbi:MAG: RluA family pseudouridine synthase [Parachlamydiales bacterium]|jgi:RluA family pseudouridine synthase